MIFLQSLTIIISFLSACCFFVAATPMALVPRQEDLLLPFGSIFISDISYSGGCPSVGVGLAPGSNNVEITYTNFWVMTGPGVSIEEYAKSCFVTFMLNHPAEWTFGVPTSDVEGFLYLNDGLVASMATSYTSPGFDTKAFSNSWDTASDMMISVSDPLQWEVDFGACPTTTQKEIAIEISMSVPFDQQLNGHLRVYRQLLRMDWEPCP